MRTSVNAVEREWNAEIWQLWNAEVAPMVAALPADYGRCYTANYYTPRIYQNQYDRGSTKEGFILMVGTHVFDAVISGGQPCLISEPPVPPWARR